jgi:Ulp1 family protease
MSIKSQKTPIKGINNKKDTMNLQINLVVEIRSEEYKKEFKILEVLIYINEEINKGCLIEDPLLTDTIIQYYMKYLGKS